MTTALVNSTYDSGRKDSLRIRHCEKAFSADEAIFLARIDRVKDCFVVPPRNDALSRTLSMIAESKDRSILKTLK